MNLVQTGEVVKGRYSSYRLAEPIGRGGAATVFRAVDLHTNADVAVKQITAVGAGEAMQQQWRAEVQVLLNLGGEGRHIVRYLDHMMAGSTIFIVEEYAPLGSLQRQLKQRGRGYEEHDAARLLCQVTCGLAYMHHNGVVHRDLKCANVLLFEDGVVKISDFGLAASCAVVGGGGGVDDDAGNDDAGTGGAGSSTNTRGNNNNNNGSSVNVSGIEGESSTASEEGQLLGSVYWMAPETARGAKHTTSSDIWALGCVCVELLTGAPPFADRPPINALFHITNRSEAMPLPQLPGMTIDCRELLLSCFHRDPSMRPSAATLMKHRWFLDARMGGKLKALAAGEVVGDGGEVNSSPSSISANNNNNNHHHHHPMHLKHGPLSEVGDGGDAAGAAASAGGVAHSSADDDAMTMMDLLPCTDDVGQWVENNLFSKSAEVREAWLRDGGLQRIVPVLTRITAGESFSIIRSFAYAAQRCRIEQSCFLEELALTDLWGYRDLSVLCRADDLATLFACCCERQDPFTAQQYAPSHPGAITFLLSRSEGEVAMQCISALHRLITNTAAATTTRVRDGVVVGCGTEALRRITVDGGLLALRSLMEMQCERSFCEGGDPPLGWHAMEMMMHMLLAAATTRPEAAPRLWGNAAEDVVGVVAGGGGGGGGDVDEIAVDGVGGDVPTERWFLAVQKSSLHGCASALKLLEMMLMSAAEAYTTTAHFVQNAGASLAGALLVMASTDGGDDRASRVELLRCLPQLQRISTKGAQSLRDVHHSLPLMACVLKRASRKEQMILLEVMMLLCADARHASAMVSCALMMEVLGELLRQTLLHEHPSHRAPSEEDVDDDVLLCAVVELMEVLRRDGVVLLPPTPSCVAAVRSTWQREMDGGTTDRRCLVQRVAQLYALELSA